MKRIVYTAHLTLRLKLRGIEHSIPQRIYEMAKERYLDQETGKLIAVKLITHRGKVREVALIYEERSDTAYLITIHPLKRYQKHARVRAGRWQKI